jgi:superfamily II DNA or RNA helicase
MEVADWMPARYRIGLSADHRRKDRKEFLIHDLFGDVAFEVTPDELEEAGAIVDVEVRVHPTALEAAWYRTEDKLAEHRLLEQITWDDARTALAADIAAADVEAGHQVLVFSHRVEHCQRLRAAIQHRGVACGMMIGGPENAAELASAVDGLKRGQLRAAVGTIQAIGTGLDLPSVSRGIVATPLWQNRQLWGQVRGRLCRPSEGKEAVIRYLHDDSALGDVPIRMLARWNRTVLVESGGMMVPAKDWIASRPRAKDRMLEGLAAAVAERNGSDG